MNEHEAIKLQEYLKKTYKGYPKEVGEACDTAISALKEIQQYREIGTVEECRTAAEKQRAKSVIIYGYNSSIGTLIGSCAECDSLPLRESNCNYCPECGQKLDWCEKE